MSMGPSQLWKGLVESKTLPKVPEGVCHMSSSLPFSLENLPDVRTNSLNGIIDLLGFS